jgi:hypothetical protein
LTGHTWRHGSTRSISDNETCGASENDEEPPCANVVEPDVLLSNGRAFELNGTAITESQKEQLWAYFVEYSHLEEEGIEAAARVGIQIASEFEAFEIPYYD